jgi:hypothetical protein
MPIRRHHRWLYPIDWRELSRYDDRLRRVTRLSRLVPTQFRQHKIVEGPYQL